MKKGILLLIQCLINLTVSQNVTRPGTSAERDSFANPSCDWNNCSKFSSTCQSTVCCQCTCDAGKSYMTANSSCISENKIAEGCTFMAQTSATAPWSFVKMTTTTTEALIAGLNIFHCTKSGCAKASECRIPSVEYENNGWKKFATNKDSEFVAKDLFKIRGQECYNERFRGLMLSLRLECNVPRQASQGATEASCMIMKIAGTYKIGYTPGLEETKCKTNYSISSIQPWDTLLKPSDVTYVITNVPNMTQHQNSTFLAPLEITTIFNRSTSSPTREETSQVTTPLKLLEASSVFYSTPYLLSTNSTRMVSTESMHKTSTQSMAKTSYLITNYCYMTKETISPSKASLYSSKTTIFVPSSYFSVVLSSSVHKQEDVGRGKTNSKSDEMQDKYLIISSIIAGTAFCCIVLLVIALLILRRKRNRVIESHKRAIAQSISVDQYILKNKGFRAGFSPPQSPPPLPPIVKLKSFEPTKDGTIYRKNLDCISLSNSWRSNTDVETDDDYDIPADLPGIQRSFSSLYAKVDKSQINHGMDRDETDVSVVSEGSESRKDSTAQWNIYDVPETVENLATNPTEIESHDFEKYLRHSRKY